jgi:hypothetical protein
VRRGRRPLEPEPGSWRHKKSCQLPGLVSEAEERGILGGGDTRPVHNTAQYPILDVTAQCGVCSKGRTPHPMVNLFTAEGSVTMALSGRGVGGQHANVKAVAAAVF